MKQKQKQIYIYICKTKLRLCCKISSFSQHINFEIYYFVYPCFRNKKQEIGSRTSAFMFCSAISHNSIISFVDTDNKAILHIII